MTDLKIISPENFKTMPWRNGKGNTVELIKENLPEGDDFAWRLSMADVTTDGDFSNFSGYDRTLLLLEGKGITLDCGKGLQYKLTEKLQAAQFKGEDPTYASLHEAPIKDFNIMTHRNFCRAEVVSRNHAEGMHLNIDTDILLIYVVEGALQVNADSIDKLTIPQQHLLVIKSPVWESMVCQGAAFISVHINYHVKSSPENLLNHR